MFTKESPKCANDRRSGRARVSRMLRQRIAGTSHILRIDSAFIGKRQQQGLVARHVVEHPEEKARLACRRSQRLGPEPGQGQEALQPRVLTGKKAQRRDGELGGGLLASFGGGLAGSCIARCFHRGPQAWGKASSDTAARS